MSKDVTMQECVVAPQTPILILLAFVRVIYIKKKKKEEGNFVRRLMDKRVFPIKSFPAEMNMQ